MKRNIIFMCLFVCSLHAAQESKAGAESAAAAAAKSSSAIPAPSVLPAPASPRGALGEELLSPRTAQNEYRSIHDFVYSFRNTALVMNALNEITGKKPVVIDVARYNRLKLSRREWFKSNRLAFKIQKHGSDFVADAQNIDDARALDKLMKAATVIVPDDELSKIIKS